MDLVKRKGGRSRIQRHVKHHHLDLLYARAALKVILSVSLFTYGVQGLS